jgi:hypothetical protein
MLGVAEAWSCATCHHLGKASRRVHAAEAQTRFYHIALLRMFAMS